MAAIIIGGHSIAWQGFKAARQLRLGMNFLMSIAILGAFIIGEYSEAAIVVFLFSYREKLPAGRGGRISEALLLSQTRKPLKLRTCYFFREIIILALVL